MDMTERNARVFARDTFHCVYCDFDGSTFVGWRYLAVDHFLPRAAGGTDDEKNLVTACCDCNFMKGKFRFATVAEARLQIGKWVAQERQIFEWDFVPKMIVPVS
jgi:5-methylcytosine-specific restriction endonuclease McrA